MILSRANLEVQEVAAREKSDSELHQVWVEKDGATVGSDGTVMMAVEGVSRSQVGAALPEFDGEESAKEELVAEGGIGLSLEVAAQARRTMPKGSLGIELGFAVVTKVGEGRTGSVELTTTDLNKHLKVEGRKARRRFPEWKGALRKARGGDVVRVCVDRRSLVKLLKAFEAAAPDPEGAVFLEIPVAESGGLVLRARNVQTNQAVVGLAFPLKTRGEWLDLTPWEERVFGDGGVEAGGKKPPPRKE